MNDIILKDLLYDIALLENDNINYNPKKTNAIILSLIDNVNDNIDIELYSPTKKSTKEFLKYLCKYKKITKKNIKKYDNDICPICLEKYKPNEYGRTLPKCNHLFHKKCIDKWFRINSNKFCPICYCSYNYILSKCKNSCYVKL